MLSLRYSPAFLTKRLEFFHIHRKRSSVVLCAAKGPRPRYPRVWKSKNRIGTISKAQKLVETIKSLSNVKEEVYGALDSFIAWDLEFPLITVKKALKALEDEKEWKRIIQVTKWMLSKGQGRTMGSYLTLLNALAQDERIEEAEEVWAKVFSENLEALPRTFYDKMISIYYSRDMHDKMFEIFADMEELGVRPSISIVSMVGNVFQKLGMLDKYEKLHLKYPPPTWEVRYIKGKRVKIRAKGSTEADKSHKRLSGSNQEPNKQLNESNENNENQNKADADNQLNEYSVENNNHLNKVEGNNLQNEFEEDDKSDNRLNRCYEDTVKQMSESTEESNEHLSEADVEAKFDG